MAMNYSEISPKGAAITGAALGFLHSLALIAFGFGGGMWMGGWGMMQMMGGYSGGTYPILFGIAALSAIILFTIIGAIIGWLAAAIYNWAIKMDK